MSTVQVIQLEVASPMGDTAQNYKHEAPEATVGPVSDVGAGPSTVTMSGEAPDPERVFRAIEPVITSPVTETSKFLITSLLVLANIIQFVSNFVTTNGGLALSKSLGRDTGPGKANWMAASFSLTQGAFVLISGRLGTIYGHQNTALVGLAIFAAFSFLNGFCHSFEAFIAMRAFTGIGGGIFMPNAVTILALMVPPGKARNVLLGLFAAAPPIGGVIGAILSGVSAASSDYWAWTYLFGGMAGSAALCLVLLWWLMPHERPIDKGGKIDFLGACLGLSSLMLYNVAWNQAPSAGWSTPYVIVILILSILLFSGFLIWERYFAVEPIMPLAIFRAPTFLALIVVVLFSYMATGIGLWYAISWQQILRNLTVMETAVNFIPFGLGSVAAVAMAAYMLPRVDAKWMMAIGVAVLMASSLLLATMPIQQSYWPQTFPAMVLCSFSPDFVYLAAQVIASNSVGRKYQGVASSLVGTLNLYGVSLGLGFAGTIETQIIKNSESSGEGDTGSTVHGFRAALYFAAALALTGLVLDLALVKMPKAEREGWSEEDEGIEMTIVG